MEKLSLRSASALLARRGVKVTVVFEKTDTFVAGHSPLPDFLRKSR